MDDKFDFLGYTFRSRQVKSKTGRIFASFTPAVSKSAGKSLRDRIRDIRTRNKTVSLEELAELMNPVIRGWANYFTKFYPSEAKRVLEFVNLALVRWTKFKYKSAKRSLGRAFYKLKQIAKARSNLFYHWQIGVRPTIG